MTALDDALARHGFTQMPAPARNTWVRGKRNGNRWVAILTDDDKLVLSCRQRTSSRPRGGTMLCVSGATLTDIDTFIAEVRRG